MGQAMVRSGLGVHQLRPFLECLWVALSTKRSARDKGLVFRKQFGEFMRWLQRFFEMHQGPLRRAVILRRRHRLARTIVFDGRSWGVARVVRAYDRALDVAEGVPRGSVDFG